MVWPVVSTTAVHHHMWFMIPLTLCVEWPLLARLGRVPWQSAFWYVLIANLISALAGIILLPFILLTAMDVFGDYDCELVTECMVSAWLMVTTWWIETVCIRGMCDRSFAKLWRPVAIGNVITYTIISIDLAVHGGWTVVL